MSAAERRNPSTRILGIRRISRPETGRTWRELERHQCAPGRFLREVKAHQAFSASAYRSDGNDTDNEVGALRQPQCEAIRFLVGLRAQRPAAQLNGSIAAVIPGKPGSSPSLRRWALPTDRRNRERGGRPTGGRFHIDRSQPFVFGQSERQRDVAIDIRAFGRNVKGRRKFDHQIRFASIQPDLNVGSCGASEDYPLHPFFNHPAIIAIWLSVRRRSSLNE